MIPLPINVEGDRAVEAYRKSFLRSGEPATIWRIDVQYPDARGLSIGCSFNLVDRTGNARHMRALQMAAAPEGYVAVLAIEGGAAVANQLRPFVCRT